MHSHLHHGQWIKCPTLYPGNLVNLVSLKLQSYVRSFSLGDHQEILWCALRTHYGWELLFNTSCRYKRNHVIWFVGADAILIQHPTVDEHLAQYASENMIPRPEWLTTIHTCPLNLSSPTWPRCLFNTSWCDQLHNPDLNLWCYPWYSPWIEFWFTITHSGSGIWLSENSFLDSWFCSQGYIAWACQVVQKSHSTTWKLLPYMPFYTYVFDSSYKPSPHRFFPLCLNLHSKKINPSITQWWSHLFPFQVSPPSHISIIDRRLTNISSRDSATNPITIDFEDQELKTWHSILFTILMWELRLWTFEVSMVIALFTCMVQARAQLNGV